MDQRQDGFAAFVAEHEQELRGTALLLTGDPVAADDLLVAALARTHRRWRRLDAPADALADTRDALLSATLGRTPLPATGRDGVLVAGPADDPDDRWLAALAGLDPRARAVTVLRLHEGRDEAEVATLLDCSMAEVGAALADALETLAPLLASDPAEPDTAPAPSAAVAQDRPVPHDVTADATHRRPGVSVVVTDPAAVYRRPGTSVADGTDPHATHHRPGTTDVVTDPYAAYRRPGTADGVDASATHRRPDPADPSAIYRRPGTPAADGGAIHRPPITSDAATDPYAIYRRPGTPPPPPVRPPTPPAPVAVPPCQDDDPDAIYRRPT
ncbi:hypothetical protein GCM10023328_40140 [Modestobacter marinus]|uniref:DNA-directed RNA polymerase specialized sigma24 family protein n=1 Tax=Modestobacter marinus TaxID=477641 RepID=A0A846LKW1_9ACTN|nr:hypothetical protein [Modestobacter marinus]NIH68683.1 DNA-directed RNA polymerase specialized sigma24 family protein [Modestobacter marinus]GGL59320.1 hypothetical protein GCM10011589_14050 [Modestobacter marinus]